MTAVAMADPGKYMMTAQAVAEAVGWKPGEVYAERVNDRDAPEVFLTFDGQHVRVFQVGYHRETNRFHFGYQEVEASDFSLGPIVLDDNRAWSADYVFHRMPF